MFSAEPFTENVDVPNVWTMRDTLNSTSYHFLTLSEFVEKYQYYNKHNEIYNIIS